MFQFAAFASRSLCIQPRILHKEWVSPFGYRWIKARLPAPHRFSQATASFIACDRQGILHMHLFACPYNECVSPVLADPLSSLQAEYSCCAVFQGNLPIPLSYIDTITTLIHLLGHPSRGTLS